MKCIYCNDQLNESNISEEHIIHNSIGGRITSPNICCSECNNKVEKFIDGKFADALSHVTSRMSLLTKTHSMNSSKSYRATAIHKPTGIKYEVIIRDSKIVDCIEYKRKYKTSKIIQHEFEIIFDENLDFNSETILNGIRKIAMNYARFCGVENQYLKNGIIVSRNDQKKIIGIEYKYNILPYCPLNPYDEYIDLKAIYEPTHKLVLFTCKNELICFVELIGVLQYYVILNEDWNNTDIYIPYLQKIDKIERKYPDFEFRRYKHMLPIASQYDVKPTFDIAKFEKEVVTKIDKESYVKEFYTYISSKLNNDYRDKDDRKSILIMSNKLNSLQFFLNDDDWLQPNRFKKFSPIVYENGASSILEYTTELKNLDKYTDSIITYREAKTKQFFKYVNQL